MTGAVDAVEGVASSWQSVFNLCNSVIGAGVLSFPFAYRCAGIVGAILLTLAFGIVEGYTLNIVGRYSQTLGTGTYQGLVNYLLGHMAKIALLLVMLFYTAGTCAAYIIAAGDTFTPIASAAVAGGPFEFLGYRRVVILTLAVFVLLPVSFRRTLTEITWVAQLALSAMLWLLLVIISLTIDSSVKGELVPTSSLRWWTTGLDFINALPIIVFAFHCHAQMVPVSFELNPHSRLSHCCGKPHAPAAVGTPRGTDTCVAEGFADAGRLSNKVAAIKEVTLATMGITTMMYIAVGVSGYVMYGDNTDDDVMNNLGKTTLLWFTRAFVGVAVLCHYPINQHVARAALDDVVRALWREEFTEFMPYWRLCLNTLAVFVVALSLALSVSSLGIVFHILGGVAATCLVFIFPGLLLIAGPVPHSASPAPHITAHGTRGNTDRRGLLHRPTEAGAQSQAHYSALSDREVEMGQSQTRADEPGKHYDAEAGKVSNAGAVADGAAIDSDYVALGDATAAVGKPDVAYLKLGFPRRVEVVLGWAFLLLGTFILVSTLLTTFVEPPVVKASKIGAAQGGSTWEQDNTDVASHE